MLHHGVPKSGTYYGIVRRQFVPWKKRKHERGMGRCEVNMPFNGIGNSKQKNNFGVRKMNNEMYLDIISEMDLISWES